MPSTYAYLVWIVVFAFGVLFLRLVFIYSVISTAQRCESLADFWLSSTGSAWPLLYTFGLTLFLLFVWTTSLMLLHWQRPVVDRVVLGLAASGVALMGFGSHMMYRASIDLTTFGGPDVWESRGLIEQPVLGEPVARDWCEAAPAFVGRWVVVSADLSSFWGESFPRDWIEFRNDLTFVASEGIMLPRIEGSWTPSNTQLRGGDIVGPEIEGAWNFVLQGDTLTLRTQDWEYYQGEPYSEIVLRRAASDE